MSQDHFDDATSSKMKNPDTSNSFVDIRDENDYVFMSNSYTGEGGYKDGNYLLAFARESWLEQRKALSSYRNFIKPIINSITEPVFNAPIIRETDNVLFEDFLLDIDKKGSNINEHCLEVATLSRLHGVTFVVMDNVPTEVMPENQELALVTRSYPYVYIQPAYMVSDYTCDYYGNLNSITFKATIKKDGKSLEQYTTWDDMLVETVIMDGTKEISRNFYYHNLGILPVIPVYSVITDKILPTPPFYDIAKINYNVYNKDSEVRDQERAQAFSIFYLQTDTDANNLVLGPHNAIVIPAGPDINITPGYASPPAEILSHLMASTEKLIESLYQIANDNGIVGLRQQTSGIAEAYKFEAKNGQLLRTAKICENYEYKLAALFGKYINKEVDYQVSYCKDYSPKININTIDTAVKLLNLNLSQEINEEIKRKLVSDVLSYLKQEDLVTLLETIGTNEKVS